MSTNNYSSQALVAQELTKALVASGRTDLEVLYTGWNDCDRVEGSCGGYLITDTGLKYRRGDNQPEESGFKLRWNNFNPKVGKVRADTFKVMVCDPNGANPRLVTLRDALRDAAVLGKGANVPTNCPDLYDPVLDCECILYVEAMFAPLGVAEDGAGTGAPAKTEFYTTAYSYQSQGRPADDPATIDLAIHPQGCAWSSATSGTKKLLAQAYDESIGKLNEYCFEAEDTGKSVDDIHTETEAESRAAAARGKGTAVAMGPPGWDKMPSLFLYVQIPRKQAPCGMLRGEGNLGGLADMADLGGLGFSIAGLKYRTLDGSDEEPSVYRSGSNLGGASGPPKVEQVDVTSCRVSRGSFFREGDGVRCTTVERGSARIAITATLVVGYAGTGAPKAADVLKVAKYLDRMLDTNANSQRLMDKADASTGAVQLTTPVCKAQKTGHSPVAPFPGMPVVM